MKFFHNLNMQNIKFYNQNIKFLKKNLKKKLKNTHFFRSVSDLSNDDTNNHIVVNSCKREKLWVFCNSFIPTIWISVKKEIIIKKTKKHFLYTVATTYRMLKHFSKFWTLKIDFIYGLTGLKSKFLHQPILFLGKA